MRKFLEPKSIVLVGASNKPGKVGHILARKIVHYKGKVFFVNNKGGSLLGKTFYLSVNDLPVSVDLAIIAVPAATVKDIVIACGKKKIPAWCIISAGFAESGQKKLQREIMDIARHYRARILGPNVFGIVNTAKELDFTFAKETPLRGNISCVTQSGALWSMIADYSQEHHLGFAKMISLGDMADLDFSDALISLEKDTETNVILVYMENIERGRRLLAVLKKMKKPVIVVKGGRSEKGNAAVQSHTGRITTPYEVYKGALLQGGATVCETVHDALALAKSLSWQTAPQGKRVVIVTNAGGPGVLCADALQMQGLELVHVPEKIQFNLPPAASQRNPIDVLGDAQADRFGNVLSQLRAVGHLFDSVIVLLTPQKMSEPEQTAREVIAFARKSKKFVICCFMGYASVTEAKKILEEARIPCFHDIEDVATVLQYRTFNRQK